MAYTLLSNGSSGAEVRKLQQTLVDNGYDVGTSGIDGIYGSGTAAAVRQYQQDNGLDVDGIAGDKTLSSLYGGAGTTSGNTATTPTQPETAPFEYDKYQQGDAVSNAEKLLQDQTANKPGEYQSKWQTKVEEILSQIQNRDDFSYDLNGDALYQQYKDQYVRQGQMAMMDSMGQAAALNGGYGSSYAQSVGQQTYQNYLQQLNDIVPDLYQLALDQYNREGDELYNLFSLYGDMENQEYGKYRDQVSDYYTELNRLYDQYITERDFDYGKYSDDRNLAYDQYTEDRAYDYQGWRDAVADQQWQAELDEQKRQFDAELAEAQRQFNTTNSGSSSGSSSGKSGGSTGSSAGSSSGKSGGSTGSSAGSSSGKSGGSTGSSAYYSIVDKCIEYTRNGASKSKISSYLLSAYKAGQITKSEYNFLKTKYGGNPDRSEAY